MGIQQNKSPPKKTEEQIKQDMKRKWDNFASTESSKINQEEGNKQHFDNNQILSPQEEGKPEEKKEEKPEEEKEEENKEVKKLAFLSLKPREEKQNEDENSGQNEENNEINKDNQINQNQIISNNLEIDTETNNEINENQEIKSDIKEIN